MAQRRARPAGFHRREPAALAGQTGVADGVDTSVDAVQVAPLDPPLHLAACEAAGQQLIEGEHAMRVGGSLRDACVLLRTPTVAGMTHPPSIAPGG
jgi:hypothetical protein